MTSGFSLRGLLIALALVALGLPAAFAGLFSIISHINRINADIATVREAQLNAADVLRLQIEEETNVRGFVATRDEVFRANDRSAAAELPARAGDLADRLTAPDDAGAIVALNDARAVNRRWRHNVADPSFATTRAPADGARAERELARFNDDLEHVRAILSKDYRRLIDERRAAVRLASMIGYSAIFVVGLQIVVYAFLAERLRGELVRERGVVASLQRAFTSEIVADRHLDIGAAYVSATRGAKVGGDVYDVFPLDEHTTLVVIADVSGKGVGAAVDSTFVKYSLRAFASEHGDIATIVRKFNILYTRAQRSSEAFVVIFAGLLDRRTSTLTYVNAGHEAAFVCRSSGIDQLPPTGPIIGLGEELSYAAACTQVSSDDLLFLSTDGLTEARDPSGTFLGSAGVADWLAENSTASPQHVVDRITRRLRAFTRARSNDDLAILAVRPKVLRERARATIS